MQPAFPDCKNCSRPLPADVDFCPACGQSAHTHRLNMHHILHDLIHVFIHADKGVIYLTKELARQPGLVVKNYVMGKRKQYFNPFSYLVLTIAISAFLTNYFHLMEADMANTNPRSAMVSKHINLIFLASVPILAFFTWLLFRRAKYNYAEHLTLHAFLGGFRVVFFILIFTPMVIFFREHYYAGLSIYFALWLGFASWANIQFFGGRKWLVVLKTVLTYALTQFVLGTGIAFAIYWLR